jgi:adenosylcobinamide kinase/adenosylcobinamide-phosphate guanylyltransferase
VCSTSRRPRWGTTKTSSAASGSTGSAGLQGGRLDSLTLWVSARYGDEEETLREFDHFLENAEGLAVPLVLVSDEVGLGVVPESVAGRRFRDVLGLVNQRATAAAAEVHLCVAGVGIRIK